MRYASFQQEGFLTEGGFARGALRIGKEVVWLCAHEHDARLEAIGCAARAEGVAIEAGLLPAQPQVKWDDPTTWSPGLEQWVRGRQRRRRQQEPLDVEVEQLVAFR